MKKAQKLLFTFKNTHYSLKIYIKLHTNTTKKKKNLILII